MSKALSASTTFEAVKATADAAMAAAGGTFTGAVNFGDANFNLTKYSTYVEVKFDDGAALDYDRSTSAYLFYIGNAITANLSASGLTVSGSISAGDANCYLTISAGLPFLSFDANDTLSYNRTSNIYSFNIGNSSAAAISLAGMNVGSKFSVSDTSLHHGQLPVYADNTAAAALSVGDFYRTSTGQLMVRF